MPAWTPPVPLCSASQDYSFARESTIKRWPIILTGVVDEIAKINGTLSSPSPSSSADQADGEVKSEEEQGRTPTTDDERKDKIEEGKKAIQDISGLIYEMRHDRVLTPLVPGGEPDDYELYNSELAELAKKGEDKWFTAPWLFAECYLYRRLRLVFSTTTHWTLFDPFQSQKLSTWRSSASGAAALSLSLSSLLTSHKPHSSPPTPDEEAKLKLDFTAIAEACLWGNATDLSLLTSLSHEEIKELQSVERGSKFLLKNDLGRAWEEVKGSKDARVDFVFDNSGFELFTDLVFADWLVTLSPYVSEVVFHPKLIPWFVSDVQPHDFTQLLSSLSSSSPFFAASDLSPEERSSLDSLAVRWRKYVDEGVWRLSVPEGLKMGEKGEKADFWTSSLPYSDLPTAAPALLEELKKSSLVIFKGDLNYRKLVSDAWWPTTTPFTTALGPLAGHFPLLSLRTCKADTVCGLDEGVEQRVEKEDGKWRVNGKYAVVSFSPRTK